MYLDHLLGIKVELESGSRAEGEENTSGSDVSVRFCIPARYLGPVK